MGIQRTACLSAMVVMAVAILALYMHSQQLALVCRGEAASDQELVRQATVKYIGSRSNTSVVPALAMAHEAKYTVDRLLVKYGGAEAVERELRLGEGKFADLHFDVQKRVQELETLVHGLVLAAEPSLGSPVDDLAGLAPERASTRVLQQQQQQQQPPLHQGVL